MSQRILAIVLNQQISLASFECFIDIPRDCKTSEIRLGLKDVDYVIECLVWIKSFAYKAEYIVTKLSQIQQVIDEAHHEVELRLHKSQVV